MDCLRLPRICIRASLILKSVAVSMLVAINSRNYCKYTEIFCCLLTLMLQMLFTRALVIDFILYESDWSTCILTYSTGFSDHSVNSCWVNNISGIVNSNRIVYICSMMNYLVCLCLIQIWTVLRAWNKVLVPTNFCLLSSKIFKCNCKMCWMKLPCRYFKNSSSNWSLGVTVFTPYLFSIKWAVSLLELVIYNLTWTLYYRYTLPQHPLTSNQETCSIA
jgi:hypothetical protein